MAGLFVALVFVDTFLTGLLLMWVWSLRNTLGAVAAEQEAMSVEMAELGRDDG